MLRDVFRAALRQTFALQGGAMKKRMRLGIFGAGMMARAHLEALRGVNEAEAVGVSWAGAKSLKRISAEFGVPAFSDSGELLARADAVSVCLPTFLHEEAAVMAAAAGRDVLCEKPLALEEAAAIRMIKACRRAGVRLMTAHCLRFWPEYVFLKKAVESGVFGAALEFHGSRFSAAPGWSSGNWLLEDSLSGGPAIDLHIHDADMILHLFGPPESARSRLVSALGAKSVHTEFAYSNGPVARADAGWFFGSYPFRMGYRAVFERAVVEYDSAAEKTLKIWTPAGGPPRAPKLTKTDGYREQIRYFARCASKGCEPEMSDGQAGLDALRLVRNALRSSETGRAVRYRPPSV